MVDDTSMLGHTYICFCNKGNIEGSVVREFVVDVCERMPFSFVLKLV